ncbi:hypothetical protein AcV7_002939 [Taiwanofungus camphoratus]|nr:hypothetical protein AcV7_002939 [Antrodia cinnamomea]
MAPHMPERAAACSLARGGRRSLTDRSRAADADDVDVLDTIYTLQHAWRRSGSPPPTAERRAASEWFQPRFAARYREESGREPESAGNIRGAVMMSHAPLGDVTAAYIYAQTTGSIAIADSIMPKSLSKVVYKPDTQSTDEYIVIVNPQEYQRWKAGDTTIPLTDVVDSFQVFFSNQGAQGLLGQASRQQLDSVFGTHKDTDAVEQLLNKGEMQAGEGFHGTEVLSKDVGRGSFTIDTRGKTLTGVP